MQILKRLETLLLRFDTFDHPLLETLKQSAIEELSTVHAAIQCEIRVAEYDFTRSIVALHRLKVQLRSWSDHIDAVSDYPLLKALVSTVVLVVMKRAYSWTSRTITTALLRSQSTPTRVTSPRRPMHVGPC